MGTVRPPILTSFLLDTAGTFFSHDRLFRGGTLFKVTSKILLVFSATILTFCQAFFHVI